MKRKSSFPTLSIIIPVGPNEKAWEHLLQDLNSLPEGSEAIFVASTPSPENVALKAGMRWLQSERGRAKQMNAGASHAQSDYLWFLHADSRLASGSFRRLFESIQCDPDALHYFNLWFQNDGPPFTPLNALGVWFRSHVLGIPFGDQGFCLSQRSFCDLGGFDESLECGEDHEFLWRAKRSHLPLRCTGSWILTSARKYRNNGWLETTLRHLALTSQQAAHYFFKYRDRRGSL